MHGVQHFKVTNYCAWRYAYPLSRTPWCFVDILFRSEEVGCDHVID